MTLEYRFFLGRLQVLNNDGVIVGANRDSLSRGIDRNRSHRRFGRQNLLSPACRATIPGNRCIRLVTGNNLVFTREDDRSYDPMG